MSGAYHTIETPRSSAGAIAMIRVVHPDPEQIGLIRPPPNRIRLAKIFDIDEGVIVRWDAGSILLMPHGGIAIVRAISKTLEKRGMPLRGTDDPVRCYREGESEIEAQMLDVLSRASSPAAVDLLLDQPARWRSIGVERLDDAARVDEVANRGVLDRLLTPPMVAAVGRANVGKSTLLNALAGEHVAIVSDTAGTTRDHVGVLVDLGGVVVRWIDTPGIDERIAAGEEIDIALGVVSKAHLIVHCIDWSDHEGQLDERIERAIPRGVDRIRVALRTDLGEPCCGVDWCVSIGGHGQTSGIKPLVGCIRSCLIPDSVLDDPRPWRFWG